MKQFIRVLLIIIFAGIFLFSAYKLWTIYSGYNESEQFYSNAVDSFVSEKPINTATNVSPDVDSPELPDTAPIEIDFAALKEITDDVVGWLYCRDTVINYPIVQAEDNAYYLHKLIDGKYNSGGSLFLDYRNTANFMDGNSIVYGHNMKDGSMFGSFMKYKEEGYYDQHPVMYLLTPEKDYRIEIFAGYITDYKSEAYTKTFTNSEDVEGFIRNAVSNSTFKSAIEPSVEDKFISLSTCSYEFDNARYVLVGRLVELKSEEAE